MTLKEFNEYLKLKVAKKQDPNLARAKSLIEESKNKKEYLETSLKLIPKDKLNPNVIVDQCYDILIELVRAKLQIAGYNTGSSHEAEVSFLKILGFLESEIKTMDELRYYRNGTKYYGAVLNIEYAEKIIPFMRQMHVKLLKILEKQ